MSDFIVFISGTLSLIRSVTTIPVWAIVVIVVSAIICWHSDMPTWRRRAFLVLLAGWALYYPLSSWLPVFLPTLGYQTTERSFATTTIHLRNGISASIPNVDYSFISQAAGDLGDLAQHGMGLCDLFDRDNELLALLSTKGTPPITISFVSAPAPAFPNQEIYSRFPSLDDLNEGLSAVTKRNIARARWFIRKWHGVRLLEVNNFIYIVAEYNYFIHNEIRVVKVYAINQNATYVITLSIDATHGEAIHPVVDAVIQSIRFGEPAN